MLKPPAEMRWLPAIAAAFLLSGCVTGGTSIQTENFNISHSGITDEQARAVARDSEIAFRQLTELFGRKPDGKVLVVIRDFEDTMRAFANQTKLRIEIPSKRFGRPHIPSGLVHEIAHVVSGPPFSGSRVLSEGFAMYAEDRFSTELSAEAQKKIELHTIVREKILMKDRYIPLERLYLDGLAFSNNHPGRSSRIGRQVAYFQSGSLVKFLIDTYGVEKFRQFYYEAPVSDVYGKSLEELEQEWLHFLESDK